MESTVLVDSCVFITLLKRGLDPALELLKHTDLEDLMTCGMVRMEVLRGLKIPRIKARLTEFFNVMQNVPTDNRVWETATETAWKLGRSGITLPAQDILIATCAQRTGAAVLTFDRHFEDIPGLKVYRSIDDL
ncbi:MAG TPA: PIN domain-containing protein [Chthoniobacteraceae bacterium]|nr:PIN domain-containing protein [Chthoniobacteraceae bacterium]